MANPVACSAPDSPPETAAGKLAPRPAAGASAQTTGLPSDQPADQGAGAAHLAPQNSDEPEITQRLRAQYAEISQLAGGLAHEIRNPLSTLSLNLDLLAEDFQNADNLRDRRVQQRVDRLKREVQRLYDILENFLRFTRVQDLKLSPTDVNALIEELCDFYEPQASTQGIVVRTHFAPDLPRPLLDADLL